MRLKSFQNYLTEKRRNPEVNRDINIVEFIKNTIGNDSLDNWFISFRRKNTVTFINPFTGYNTPAGYYAYPFNKEDYNRITAGFTNSTPNEKIKERLERFYPFIPNMSNVIHLFKIKENKIQKGKILTHDSEVLKHIEKFYKICKSNKKLKNNLPQDAFDLLFNYIKAMKSNNKSERKESFKKMKTNLNSLTYSRKYSAKWNELSHTIMRNTKNYQPTVETLWFFVNNYVDLALREDKSIQFKTKIYLDLDIEGFIDKGEDWFIHPNEPEQAVFFKKDVIDKFKSYDINSFSSSPKETLNYVVDGTFEIDGNIVNIKGNVNLKFNPKNYKKIINNYRLKYISGNFDCSGNKLTTLEGAPEEVGGDFDCSHNNLASLEDAPKKVGGEFNCLGNSLTSLKGAPEKVGGDFDCFGNNLTSLEGAPEKVGGDFICDENKKDFTKEDVKAVSDVEGRVIV
jgi:hypothetical protein